MPDKPDEFYVGYLPMPAGDRRFIKAAIFTLVLSMLGIAAILVLTMRDPGDARWETGKVQSWSGVLLEHPYPMLVPENQKSSALFVISMGKRGAHDRLSAHFGKKVTLSGYELSRDGRRLIELLDTPDAIEPLESVSPSPKGEMNHIKHTILTGEIVDGKCYLGAMKPGDGMGHQSCAALCIKGGLPPMFVANTDEGDLVYYLLLIDGSTQLPDHILAMLGRPVTIEGDIAMMQGIPILQTTASLVTRSDPFAISNP